MTGRPFTRADYLAVKFAFRMACEDIGPLHVISSHTRVDPAMLSRYCSADRPEFPPIDVMMDVDALSGGDRCLHALAKMRSYDLVRDEKGVAVEDMRHHASNILKEAGEAIHAMGSVVGKPTPSAAAACERELAELADVIDLAQADCRRIRAVK
jgi:hypothetical protein